MGVARVSSLWHSALWHNAVLLYKALEHIPLATITNWVGKQEGNKTAVQRLIKGIQNVLKEPVGLLHLVPEQRICLRKLKCGEVVFLDDAISKRIEGSKHPATARALLVGTLTLLYLNIKSKRIKGNAFWYASCFSNTSAGSSIFSYSMSAVGLKVLLSRCNVVKGNAFHLIHMISLTGIGNTKTIFPIKRSLV